MFFASLNAQLLNDVERGTFVDIGLVSGLHEIETPKIMTNVQPDYSIVDNIIMKSNRKLELDNCFIGSYGSESCMKDEEVCEDHIEYGSNSVIENSNSVIDYVNYTYTNKVPTEVYNNYSRRHGYWNDGTAKCVNGTFYWESWHSSWHTTQNYRGPFPEWFFLGQDRVHYPVSCPSDTKYNNYCKIESNANIATGIFNQKKNSKYGRVPATSCFKTVNKCPSGYSDNGSNCKKCPTGYTDGPTRCNKLITYKYYSYKCDNGFDIVDKGRTSCSKTDPDLSTINDSVLTGDCNLATPPSTNCFFKWTTCPVDSSKDCTFKGSGYKIFLPLRKFQFSEDSFFKKWEFGKRRGWECTSLSEDSQQKYDCQFGIKKVEAIGDKICFTDMQGYRDCIYYRDESECNMSGIIESSGTPIKDISVSVDGHELYSKNITNDADNSIKSECLFNGKVGFEDVGLGTISVKAESNRLTFWNSYDSDMVGFVDILPKLNANESSRASVLFDFKNYSISATSDIAINGSSKEVLKYGSIGNIVEGHSDNGLSISNSNTDIYTISGGSDLNLKMRNSFSISFWIKPTISPLEDKIIIMNQYQLSIKLSPELKLKARLLSTDNSVSTVEGTKNLTLNEWAYVTYAFNGKDIYLFIDDSSSSSPVNGVVDGDDSPIFYIGSLSDGTNKIDAVIDDISISKVFKEKVIHDISLNKLVKVSDYIGTKDLEVEKLLKNGFSNLYKSFDNHIYMTSNSKLTSTECSQLIQDTTFYNATANANLDSYTSINQSSAGQIIQDYCKDSRLKDCETDPTSVECTTLNISSIASERSALATEIFKACDEARLIRGLSKESFNNQYLTASTKTYCVIESTDVMQEDLLDVSYIEKTVLNTGVNVDKFVCSPYDCNTEHICGVAKCQDDTNGTIGLVDGFIGCSSQSCDFSKVFSATCGSYTGCPQGRNIVSSTINMASLNNKEITISAGGYDVNSDTKSIVVNDVLIATLKNTWNILVFNEDTTVKEFKSFDTEHDPEESEKLSVFLNSITENESYVIVTYGEPSVNVVSNTTLQSNMAKLGLNIDIVKRLEYRSIYLYIGQKNKDAVAEIYKKRFSDSIVKSFNMDSFSTRTKCYEISCPSDSIFDVNTQTCNKIGCDEKSILKDEKCISTVVQ